MDFAVGLVWRWYLQGSQDVGSASAMTIVASSCGVRQPKCVQREAITSAPIGTEALAGVTYRDASQSITICYNNVVTVVFCHNPSCLQALAIHQIQGSSSDYLLANSVV